MPDADDNAIKMAAEVIRKGGLVAMPTETVYGLAADATNDRAVARIFEAKGRPRFNPLIVHVTDIDAARDHADFSPLAERLAKEFWPGPLTLILPRRAETPLSLLVSAGLDTVALRAPSAPVAQALLKAAGRPLAAPSANRSGAVSPTTAEHVRDSLDADGVMILDGGACPLGVESTIVKIDGDTAVLLRPGGVPAADIERVLGKALDRESAGPVEAPGMMASHYAPAAPLRLDITLPRKDEVYLAFGAAPSGHPHTLNLSKTKSLGEAAANLFAHLRAADRLCADHDLVGIAAAPIPMNGLGEAIIDRLTRAAAPRQDAR